MLDKNDKRQMKSLDKLSRENGAEIIIAFQSGSVLKPVGKPTKRELEAASLLEAGMKKRFHFLDGTVREGEILSIENNLAVLKTGSGVFEIPTDEFLSETAQITNKKGECYSSDLSHGSGQLNKQQSIFAKKILSFAVVALGKVV